MKIEPAVDRPTLVLLPGMDGTGRLFRRLEAELPGRNPVRRIELPADRAVGYPGVRDLLESSLPPDTDYAVLAESYSGPAAIEHAAMRPPGLRALILSTSFASSPVPGVIRWLGSRVGETLIRPTDSMVRLLLVGRDAPSDLVAEVRTVIDSVDRGVLVDRIREVLAVDVRSRLGSISVPVLYLAGRRDRLVGRRGLSQCSRIPRFTSVILDAPHFLLQRRPDEAAEAILRFLAEAAG